MPLLGWALPSVDRPLCWWPGPPVLLMPLLPALGENPCDTSNPA
jgi:hypothetical protein